MKRILVFLAAVLMSFSLISAPAMAAGEDDTEKDGETGTNMCTTGSFLGFVPWYRGLTEKKNGKCEIITPDGSDGITRLVVTVILNVTADLSLAVGYLAVGFVVYGGYLYVMAAGDPGKVAKGKKTLQVAVIGTVIAVLASVIMNFIVSVFISGS